MNRFDKLVREELEKDYRLANKPAFVSRVIGELTSQDMHTERGRMTQTRFDIIQSYVGYCLIYIIIAFVVYSTSPHISDLLVYMQSVAFTDFDFDFDFLFLSQPYFLALMLAGTIWFTGYLTEQ